MRLKEGDHIRLIGHAITYRIERVCGRYDPMFQCSGGIEKRAYIVSDNTGNFYHITDSEIKEVM